eukprot:TRINITY_DN4957_c0_g1_i16.p1 TRINITY_DN4957_c0_g1~~TRINITY_DN4957_c0_g1_i16.p1  ORF type:complete len:312 (-),score=58.74 TRINITY_DN4957_c0_g1_i16:403-1338(-)
MDLIAKESLSFHEEGRLWCTKAVITFFGAFDPQNFLDYYTASWERARLVLLGIQDPQSTFSVIKDTDFIWNYFFQVFKSVMNENVRDHQFPGISVSDGMLLKMDEVIKINDVWQHGFGNDEFAKGARKIGIMSKYFTCERPLSEEPCHVVQGYTHHPFWRMETQSGVDEYLTTLHLRFQFNLAGLDSEKQTIDASWMVGTCSLKNQELRYSITKTEWDLKLGQLHLVVVFWDDSKLMLTLHRLGHEYFGVSYFGQVKCIPAKITPDDPVLQEDIPVVVKWLNLEKVKQKVRRWLLLMPSPFNIVDPQAHVW